jgi:hypothetical protein
MATGAAPPADEKGRVLARRSFVLLLLGPAVLLVGSALGIGGLFLPWYHADARYLVGDPYPSDFQPFVPVQSLYDGDLFWLVLAAIPIMATLVCLLIDATPRLRRQGLIRGSAVCLGLLTLVAGGGGIFLLIQFHRFLHLAGTVYLAGHVPALIDSGYFVSLAGYILLVPGAILLMIGQTQVRQLVRLGRLRAP